MDLVRSTACQAPVRTYFSGSDMLMRTYWSAALVGFTYRLDAQRLRAALQTAVDKYYTFLTCRARQDEEGRYYMDNSNEGIPFRATEDMHATLESCLPAFVMPSAPEYEPMVTLAAKLTVQLDNVGISLGTAPLLGVQLTNVGNGSVLSVSISHLLADAEGTGQFINDLAQIYRGVQPQAKAPDRLQMHLLSLRASGLCETNQAPADQELIKSLPKFPPAETSMDEVVDNCSYDLFGLTKKERAAGMQHSHHLLHVPGAGIKRLQAEILSSRAAEEAGVTALTLHDILCAIIWMSREVAAGNDLSSGLKRCMCYAIDMRRRGASEQYAVPTDLWGNAISANVVMPPACDTTASPPSAEHLKAILTLAVCAINTATKTMRADPDFMKTAFAMTTAVNKPNYNRDTVASPGFVPFRDGAGFCTCWRSGSIDRVDFGHGVPWFVTGKLSPTTQAFVITTAGPGGDGALCTPGFKDHGFERLMASHMLSIIAPEARFIEPSPAAKGAISNGAVSDSM